MVGGMIGIAKSQGYRAKGCRMKVEGTFTIKAGKDRVWELMQDPDVLAACIPGCEKLETDRRGFLCGDAERGRGRHSRAAIKARWRWLTATRQTATA